jgi:Ca2+-binding RTX toxin-like protein
MARLVVTAIIVALLAVPIVGSSASAAKPKCQGFTATIVGNNKPNVIKGTNRRDIIVSKGGNDKIFGRGGNDIICSGPGKDTVKGGSGKDRIYGGDKNDILNGGSSWDVLDGGKGKDVCWVGSGSGRKVRCEEADLRVKVYAASNWPGGPGDNPFRISISVKNIGVKTATAVELEHAYGTGQVTCHPAIGITGTKTLPTLTPGEYKEYWWDVDCDAPDGATGAVVMEATATSDPADDNPANNTDDSTTIIEAP